MHSHAHYSFALYQYVKLHKIIPIIHIILQLEDDDSLIQDTSDHFPEEIIAQAACQAYATQHDLSGRVYAVGKKCGSIITCTSICESPTLHAQDSQTVDHEWSCIAGFHVYFNRPKTTRYGQPNTAVLGLKSVIGTCTFQGCGPNFCCCIAE